MRPNSTQWLTEGKILAVKGLGGFHLVCDAANVEPVNLAQRKHRTANLPYVFDLPTIEKYVTLLLQPAVIRPQAPIILAKRPR